MQLKTIETIRERYPDAVTHSSCASVPSGSLCVSDDDVYQTPFIRGYDENTNPRVYVLTPDGKSTEGRYHWGATIILKKSLSRDIQFSELFKADEFFGGK